MAGKGFVPLDHLGVGISIITRAGPNLTGTSVTKVQRAGKQGKVKLPSNAP